MGLILTVVMVVGMVSMVTTEYKLRRSEEKRRVIEEEIRQMEAKRYILETEKMKREMLI